MEKVGGKKRRQKRKKRDRRQSNFIMAKILFFHVQDSVICISSTPLMSPKSSVSLPLPLHHPPPHSIHTVSGDDGWISQEIMGPSSTAGSNRNRTKTAHPEQQDSP